MKKALIFIFILFLCSFYILSQDTQMSPEKTPLSSKETPLWGVGFKISGFGIPKSLLDLFFFEHPEINGSSYSFEIRSYGSKGPKSVFSGLFALEYNKMSGNGPWRLKQFHRKIYWSNEISQISLTATIFLNIFPSFPVHPYIGAGIGIEKISIWSEGVYKDELGTEIKENYNKSYPLPVGHIPIGIIVNIFDRVEVRLEGGFKNGFYIGGSAVYYLK